MKPKHRVMCPECWRSKMLFDSEKAAMMFIKYNGADLPKHSGELRAYYCEACGGWHITSHAKKHSKYTPTHNLIEAYHNDLKNKSDFETRKLI